MLQPSRLLAFDPTAFPRIPLTDSTGLSRPNPRLLTLRQSLQSCRPGIGYDLNLGTLRRFTSLGVGYDLGLGPTKSIPIIDIAPYQLSRSLWFGTTNYQSN